VTGEDHTTVLALLDERRVNLAHARLRTANHLHALLRDLVPAGAPLQLTADQAVGLLRRVRPAGPVERGRKQLARQLAAELRTLDARPAENAEQLRTHIDASGSTLMHTAGIGPVMAARLIARTGQKGGECMRRLQTYSGRIGPPGVRRLAESPHAIVTAHTG